LSIDFSTPSDVSVNDKAFKTFSLKLNPEQIEIRHTVRKFAKNEIKPIALARDR
jgi:S-adenosylmethionine/arginine decarboxylase-like enzyme